MEDISFGSSVRQRRRELDLTQEELARRVGCAAITIRKIEADDARPSLQIAERLAMALAIPLDQRAEFIRRARTVRIEPEETPTPAPRLEEIGSEDLTGRAIRGYALSEKIGAGGMGAVYRAVQPLVEREVAIKIILPSFANHPDFIRRFEAEAQLVARLEHPHIVPLYDYWREPGVAYLVMRLLRGGSLQGLLSDGPLPIPTVSKIVEQVCQALHAAHRIGIVHRDLKPGNILLDEDQNAYLADFGIAKNLGNPDVSNETELGMMIGSPNYMSPEQIQARQVQPQTDIYCLGVMLYEMLTGKLPFNGPTPFDLIQQHMTRPMPSLAEHISGLPTGLDRVLERATAKSADERYDTSMALWSDFQQAIGGMTGGVVFFAENETPSGELFNPYKGLRAFSEADADDFFGRETLVQQLLARLGEGSEPASGSVRELARFLAVIGPSGSGKSSVVKAGLIPALRRGGLVGSENWFYVDMLPGPHPFEELEAALLRVAVNPPPSLLEQLKSGDRGLGRAVNRILPGDPQVQLILVVDQFEELFTLVESEEERALFLNSLVTAVLDERSRVRIIITLRADFIDRPLRYVDFGELLQRRNELVLPLTPDELEYAILGPARRVGLKLESGLVSAMIREVGDQPGSLPLLQYALTELFELRKGNLVTKEAYQSIGGVLGALGRRAEDVFTHLNTDEQSLARQMFLRLVTLGEGTEDTRRRVLRAELENITVVSDKGQVESNPPSALTTFHLPLTTVLDAFGKSRLLSFDRDPLTRSATVEVAHEALLREWKRFREWLDESRSDVRMQRQLALSTREWMEAREDASFLLVGSHLEQFEGWAMGTTVALTQQERSFLGASIAERDRREVEEQSRQRRELETVQRLAETERLSSLRMRNRNRVITVIGAFAFIAAIVAVFYAFRAQAQQRVAENERLAAEAYRIASDPAGGSELAALLSIRAQKTNYYPEADIALIQAMPNLLTRFIIHPDPVATGAIAYSPDGSIFATGQINNTVQLWDANTGKLIRTLVEGASGLASQITTISFSPSGDAVLVGNKGGAIRLIDLSTGEYIQTYSINGANDVTFAGFSGDGRLIFGASRSFTGIYIWEMLSGKRLSIISTPANIRSATISQDGRFILVSCSDMNTYLWDISTNLPIQVYKNQNTGISSNISPDGKFVVIGDSNGVAKLYETHTGKLVREFEGHLDYILHISFSPDGKFILTSSWDGTARLWSLDTGEQLHVFAHRTGDAVIDSVFSSDGKSVLTGTSSGEIRMWRIPWPKLATGDPTARYAPDNTLVYSFDGQNFFSFNSQNLFSFGDAPNSLSTLSVLDANTGVEINSFQLPKNLIGFEQSRDGQYIALIYIPAPDSRKLEIRESQTGKLIHELEDGYVAYSAAFSPDSSTVLIQTVQGTRLWDVKTGASQGVPGFSISVYQTSLAWSPNGKLAVISSGENNGIAQLLDMTTKSAVKILGTYSNNENIITATAFSPDSNYVLTGNANGTAQLWDVETEQLIREFKGYTAEIWFVAFSPDGKYIATASNDKTVRLWDVNTGSVMRVLYHEQSYVFSVEFSNDGKYILSNGGDGARLWDTDYRDTMRAACSLLVRDLTPEERTQYGITDSAPTCP